MNQLFNDLSDSLAWDQIRSAFSGGKISIKDNLATIGKEIADAFEGLPSKIENARKDGKARVSIYQIEIKAPKGSYLPDIRKFDELISELKFLFSIKGYNVQSQRFLQKNTGEFDYYSHALYLELIPVVIGKFAHEPSKESGQVEYCA